MKFNVHVIQTLMDLSWSTRDLTVGILPEFRVETSYLLRTTCNNGRESVDVKELQLLVGNVDRIGQEYCPIYPMIPMLYALFAFDLRETADFLYSASRVYTNLIKR